MAAIMDKLQPDIAVIPVPAEAGSARVLAGETASIM
jgi:hypothetical protein